MTDTRSIILRNAKGRETVYAMLLAVAERTGAKVEREDLDPREIVAYLRLNGAACMIILDADTCRHDFFSGHWHFDTSCRDGRLYRSGFDGAGHKPHHKATTMTTTAEDLCAILEARFGEIATGAAFVPETAR